MAKIQKQITLATHNIITNTLVFEVALSYVVLFELRVWPKYYATYGENPLLRIVFDNYNIF